MKTLERIAESIKRNKPVIYKALQSAGVPNGASTIEGWIRGIDRAIKERDSGKGEAQ
jgi:hypothetical protein